jgi:HSP20 family molecular chaperone IbpA
MSTFLQKLKKNQTETELLKAQLKDKELKDPEAADDSVSIAIDMSKTKDEVVVVAHVPGVSKDSVKVRLEGENDILTIEGENNAPKIWRQKISKGKREDLVKAGLDVKTGGIRECKYGPFFRKIVLPEEVEFKKQFVTVANGIIEVHLPLYNPNNTK